MAEHYDFDYLIEKEAGVRHYELPSQASLTPFTQRVALYRWMLKNRSAADRDRPREHRFSKSLHQLPDGR